MKKLLFVTRDRYPQGDAGAVRLHILSLLFNMHGYQVDIIGLGPCTNFKFVEEGINRYISLRGGNQSILNRIVDRLLFPFRAAMLSKNKQYAAFLVESIPLLLQSYLCHSAKKRNIPIIHDSVEWYSASEFKRAWLSREYLEKELLNTLWISNNYKIIAISSFLENHFISKGCTTIRIPFVLDVEAIANLHKCHEKIIIQYAGLPGNKDYVDVFLQALAILPQKEEYEVRLFGITKEFLYQKSLIDENIDKSLSGILKCYGRVPRNEVLESLQEADFTILFRNPAERYAKAGFPTKVVESLSHGVPVLCNISSDLADYLCNNINSVIVDKYCIEDIFQALTIISKMSRNHLEVMKNEARKTAVENFDYRLYYDKIKKLI